MVLGTYIPLIDNYVTFIYGDDLKIKVYKTNPHTLDELRYITARFQ